MSSATKWVGQRTNHSRENMLSCKVSKMGNTWQQDQNDFSYWNFKTLHRSDSVLRRFLLELPLGTSMRLGRPLFKNAGKVRAVAPIPEM